MNDIIAADIRSLLDRTPDLWRELRGASLFITGGTGFFGTWLVEAILAANRRFDLGCHVTVLSRDPARFAVKAPHCAADPAITLIAGDVRDFRFPEGPVTHVIHAATDVTPPGGTVDSRTIFDTCVAGTRRAIELARQLESERFLLVSSGAIYGRQPADLSHIAEDFAGVVDPLVPLSAYAAGKREAEALCVAAAEAAAHERAPLHVTIARCFAFVGPRLPLDAHYAIGNFIRDAIGGGPITIHGDGSTHRSYLYASDMVQWLITILIRGRNAEAYNVGHEDAVSVGQLAEEVATVAQTCLAGGRRPHIVVRNQEHTGLSASRLVPCCRRAREELGLVPSVARPEAIYRTMRHAMDQKEPLAHRVKSP
jgi:dTDP-glucose 4,6-dehydratase